MKIAILTADGRQALQHEHLTTPSLGSAPYALLEGLAEYGAEHEIHVIACNQKIMPSDEKLFGNVWFHSLHVPKIGWLRTGYQGCIRAVRRKLRDIRPDIVHGQGTERDSAISAVFSGYPNVLTIHGNMKELARLFRAPAFSVGGLAARLEDFTLPRTAGVFCNSAYTESLVAPRAKKVWRVPNALRGAFFRPIEYPTVNAAPAVLNVGVISPRKRQLEILEFAERLHARGHRFILRFIGVLPEGTSYGARFLEGIEKASRAGYARFDGNQSTEQLIRLFDSSQALVHFPTEEAFGLAVAEALARNLKFFGARLGGIQDIASGVDQAEIFPESDWVSLEDSVSVWLENGTPRPQLAQAAMAQRYHPRVIADRHLEIYREVLRR